MENSVSKLVQYFEEAEQTTSTARQLSERDRDYYDNDQWTAEELAVLKKRKQPALVINYIKRKVEFLRGFERRLRSDPKAYPRNKKDEQGAEAATDVLRFVGDANDFEIIRSEVHENLIIKGTGGVDVVVEQGRNGYEVKLKQVPWDRFFYDPHSRERDFSDAKYKGLVIWMDKDEALEKYPGKEHIIESTFINTAIDDTYDDRPQFQNWCDSKRTRIRIVQIHYREKGEWMSCVITKGGHLTEPKVSSYLDRYGKPTSTLIMRSAYITRNNDRYGAVRDMISLQDEINKRRSKSLHLLNSRRYKLEKGAVTDLEAARRELNKADGMVEVTPGMLFDELGNNDMAQGQFQLLQQATIEMQGQGPNAALSGKDTRQQSGRAIQAQQEGGSIEMEPLVDELRQWSRDVYEAIWERVRQFWTEERWLRVTDDERNIKWVGLNHPVTLAEKLEKMEEAERAQTMQQLQLVPGDPRLQEVVETGNIAADLDVDIIVEEGPDISTLQSEQFEQLINLAASGMTTRDGKPIPLELIIKASSLRNKDELLDIIEGKDEENQEGPSQKEQELIARLQAAEQAMQEADAEAQELIAQKEAAEAKSVNQDLKNTNDQEKLKVEKFKAVTERMSIQRDAANELLDDPDLDAYVEHNPKKITDVIEGMEQLTAQNNAMLQDLLNKEDGKVISINTPSGEYRGVRQGGQVQIQLPSGEVYDGTVN